MLKVEAENINRDVLVVLRSLIQGLETGETIALDLSIEQEKALDGEAHKLVIVYKVAHPLVYSTLV